MIYLRDRLASYEVHVAQYYYKRGAYIAAAQRARVPGREAERILRTLEFEAEQLTEAVTVLRKFTRTLAGAECPAEFGGNQ